MLLKKDFEKLLIECDSEFLEYEGLFLPVERFEAILKTIQEKEISIEPFFDKSFEFINSNHSNHTKISKEVQKKSGIKIAFGGSSLSIFCEKIIAKKDEKKVGMLTGIDVARIKNLLKYAKRNDDSYQFKDFVKFENDRVILCNGFNLIILTLSHATDFYGYLHKSVFTQKINQKKTYAIIKQAETIGFGKVFEKFEDIDYPDFAKVIPENKFECVLTIPDSWKGYIYIDFEEKTIRSGSEEEAKIRIDAVNCEQIIKGVYVFDLNLFPFRGKVSLFLKEQQSPFSCTQDNIVCVLQPVHGGYPFEIRKVPAPAPQPQKNKKIIQVSGRFFQEKTEYFFIFDREYHKRCGSFFRKVTPDEILQDQVFRFNNTLYNAFTGMQVKEDFTPEKFLLQWKSPKYREIKNK